MSLLASRSARYAAAVGATAVALVLRLLLTPFWGDQSTFITHYPAIVLSAWLGGFGPGLLATLLSAITFLWLFATRPPSAGDVVTLVLFLGIGLFISWLIDALQRAQARLSGDMRNLQDQTLARAREGEAQSRLAAIVLSSDDAIISKTLDGNITSWNAAATRMFGYQPEEILGRSITTIIPRARLGEETTVLSAIRRGETIDHFETVRLRKDGTTIPISLTVSPIKNADGEIIGASKIARDISARKQADEERATLLAREQAARREAEVANRAKDEFLAILGHELRNPLGAISNAIHVLEHTGRPDDAHAAARGVIARQTATLSRLMDDLLDVGRVITGKVTLDLRVLDLHEVTLRALGTLKASGQSARHHVAIDGSSLWIEGDVTRIEQIVVNLLTNALKFTPPAGSIRIHVVREAGMAALRVADDGIGIDPAFLPRIFDLFTQGQAPPDRVQAGLGIGLTLVKRLVELHGGTVEAQSDGPGRGATITVRFPMTLAPARATLARSGVDAVRRRILLVEDNDDARTMLRSLLELWHHTVQGAADGPSGIEAARQFRPEVAIIDVGLPGVDGYEVARQLRTMDASPDLQLIALTGYGAPRDALRAQAAGFDVHLVKPVDPDRLMEVLSAKRRVSQSVRPADGAREQSRGSGR